MKLYKLTDQDGYTRRGETGETKWSAKRFGLTLPRRKNPKLCSPDVFHAYKNLNLGLLLNPGHANFANPKIWEASGVVQVEDYGKCGVFSLKIRECLRVPDWYSNLPSRHRVQTRFAVLCAESVIKYFESRFPEDDRPRKAIEAAKEYLGNPSSAARASDGAYYASRAASRASDAAYYAADGAYYASRAAYYASDGAYYASRAARAAYYAADGAYYASRAAARASDGASQIDFGALADLAVEMEQEHAPHA